MHFLYAYCARAGKGTRVQLWISYMHIVRGPEKASGSNYGFPLCIVRELQKALGSNYAFPICILCESRKRHQGPIMDFLYAYCARAGKGVRVQLWISSVHSARAAKGTRVQLCISYMHLVRGPEKAPGSNYGFPICILCEGRKRHQGPIM